MAKGLGFRVGGLPVGCRGSEFAVGALVGGST